MNVKRIISVLSILLLAFTSFFTTVSPVSANSSKSLNLNTKQTYEKLQPERSISESQKQKSLMRKMDNNVRVIVEMEGDSPIEYATKRGTLYKDLSESKKQELEQEAKSIQNEVQEKIQSEKVTLDVEETFTTVINGFSGQVKMSEIEQIRNLPNVEDVYISTKYNRPQLPDMDKSHDFIQSYQTWGDAQFKGEGQVISVIDSGVDPEHKDFNITSPDDVSLTQETTEAIVSENDLPGKYYNTKVPYGYNYYDKNDTILDLGPNASMHGMHVAGTTAANGEIKGVAPEAQVLGMKVFSNDPNFPSTWEDIYIKAIDDSIKLGADVINMSLGSTAAFYESENIADQAITKATDNGIVVSVSAGNSGHIGYGYPSLPLADNPDIGVVGSPGLSKNSIQVAATGNYTYLYETSITVGDVTATGYGADDWDESFEATELPIVSIGGKYGHPEDYDGVDVDGKVALVQRGELSFYDKSVNAKEAGAVGIIVYDHGNGAFYKDQGGWDIIPFMKISKEDGAAIEAAISNGAEKVSFSTSNKQEGPEVGQLTEFSSWGTTPSLELKPEISAPGGNIYSTFQDDEYGVMSGTSMAAPHVAGGSALVMQYLKEEFPDLKNGQLSSFAKVLLMNTADVIFDDSEQPVSPRRQGSGMMQTFAAVNTPITVTEENSGEAKVELKDFTSKKINFSLEAENHSDESISYSIDTSVLTDTEQDGKNLLIAGDTGADVKVSNANYEDGVLTIQPNSTETIDVTIDLSNATMPGTSEDLRENSFIEGFVTLTNDTYPDVSVPYVGFYGEWDEPDIFDGNLDLGEASFYGFAGMLDQQSAFMTPNAGDEYAISPNGDGYNDGVMPLPSFLRNARTVEYNILDENKEELRTIREDNYVRKNYYDAGDGSYYSYDPNRLWNGTVQFNKVEDGEYFYELKAKVDYEDAKWQTKHVPIVVDTVKPEVDVTFVEKDNKITWETTEEGSGIRGYDVYVNGESVLESLLTDTEYTLTGSEEGTSVSVVAVDYAMNIGESTIFPYDDNIPVISLTSPEPLTGYGSQEILVAGSVTDATEVSEFTVNGQSVEIVKNEETGAYDFETKVTYEEDGVKEITVSAKDVKGNDISITRTIFVDSTPGEIVVNSATPNYVESYVSNYELDVTLKDNYRQMDFYVNDNHEYNYEFDVPLLMDGHEENMQLDLPLKQGENSFLLRLEDLGGHVTTKEVNIYRLAKGEDEGEGGDDGGEDDNDQGGSTTPNKVTSEVISKNDKKQVSLELDGDGDIYYTTNTSLVEYQKNGNQESYQFAEDEDQLQKWEKYTEPFEIEQDETVFAVAMHQNETGLITKAASPAVKKWESLTGISRDKQFTIEFNETLQSSTVNEDTVYVTKESGAKVSVDVALSDDGKKIVVDSKYGYDLGQTYTLHISQHIKAENGYFLKESVEMEFSR